MAFPTGWVAAPGRGLPLAENIRSFRVFIDGRATKTPGPANTNFEDQAFSWWENGFVGLDNVWVPIQSQPMTAPGSTQQVSFGAFPSGLGAPQVGPDGTVPLRTVVARIMKIANDDATNDLEFSFDGVTVHGVLKPGEVMDFVEKFERGIAFRASAGTCEYRFWAW